MRISFSGTKLHKKLVQSNKYVEREYENYIRINSIYGKKRKRIREWFFLLRLNLAYFILNRNSQKEEKQKIKEQDNAKRKQNCLENRIILGKDDKFWVSIILSVYNVEKYIDEAIESIINQTVGFDKIQLIIVNDGSTDDSGNVCKFYADKYPENVKYVEKENGGQSSARNEGLKHATGKYVNFMDPDDTISENLVHEVVSFFENNYLETDMVCVPLVYFEAETGIHGKYKHLGSQNRIISLVKQPENFILSAASSFYKREMIKKLHFDERLMTEEDTKFNLAIVRRTLNIGYVCERGVQYNYRKRLSGGSNVDILSSGSNISSLMAPIHIFEEMLNDDGELAPYEKELIVYELRSRIKLIDENLIGKRNYEELLSNYKKWICRLDMAFISKSFWLETIDLKMLFISMSGHQYGDFCRRGFSYLPERLVVIRDGKIARQSINVTVSFNNYMDSNIDLVMISSEGKVVHSSISKDFRGPFDVVYGKYILDDTHLRIFSLPFSEDKYVLSFYDNSTDSYSRITRKPLINPKSRICSGIRGLGPICFHHCLSINGPIIYIDKNISWRKAKNTIIQKYYPFMALKKRLYDGDKKYILINDRPEKAGDNGEALFYYIMEKEEEAIRKCTYYVINKESADYAKMKYKGHIIDFRSQDHFEKFINSKIIFSSHNAVKFIYPFDVSEYKYFADLLKFKFVWLQHGVTKDDICKEGNALSNQDDAVVVATKWEADSFTSEKYCYVNKNQIIQSGFARFDRLYNAPEKLIIIMPTWRTNLVGEILASGHNAPLDNFVYSNFYKNYIDLLTDDRFIKLLKKYGYKAEFILHSGFSCYEGLFSHITNNYISLVNMDTFSYRDAFAKAELLITDFSSTAFDFASLEKPVIYFQFDEDDFYRTHYQKGSWDYREDGLGPVVTTAEELIKEIVHIAENKFKMEEKYLERTRKCFIHRRDQNNCKRIIDATKVLFGFEDIPMEE